MKKIPFAAIALLLSAVIGCAALDEYLQMIHPKGVSKEYDAVLKKWTREQTLYSELDTRVRIVSTFKSPEFNRAYHEEYARLYGSDVPQTDKTTGGQADAAASGTEFFFYAYTPEPESNDFAKGESSTWKVFLVNGKGEKIYPEEIRLIKKVTPVIQAFFPYINQYYGKFYTAAFPAGGMTDKTLVFTGALGRVELNWRGIPS